MLVPRGSLSRRLVVELSMRLVCSGILVLFSAIILLLAAYEPALAHPGNTAAENKYAVPFVSPQRCLLDPRSIARGRADSHRRRRTPAALHRHRPTRACALAPKTH